MVDTKKKKPTVDDLWLEKLLKSQDSYEAIDEARLREVARPITKLAFPTDWAQRPEILDVQQLAQMPRGTQGERVIREVLPTAVGMHYYGQGGGQPSNNYVQRTYKDGSVVPFQEAAGTAAHEYGHGYNPKHDDVNPGIMGTQVPETPKGMDSQQHMVHLASQQGGRALDAEQRDTVTKTKMKNLEGDNFVDNRMNELSQRILDLVSPKKEEVLPSKSFDMQMMLDAEKDSPSPAPRYDFVSLPFRPSLEYAKADRKKAMLPSKGGKSK
jgi:hypothetical protein